MEAICTNSTFLPEIVAFYAQHGIVTPLKDVIYNFRSLTKNSEGNYEVLLEEIHNKEIPIKHKILGIVNKEPAWALSRFVTLNQEVITEEMIKEILKTEKV